MGRSLIIKGADFSSVAVDTIIIGPVTVEHLVSELLTTSGYFNFLSGSPVSGESTNWKCVIMPVKDNLHVQLLGTKSDNSGVRIPPVFFLSGSTVDTYISNSEIYGTGGTDTQFKILDADVTVPSGATYMVLQTSTNSSYGYSSTWKITWTEE